MQISLMNRMVGRLVNSSCSIAALLLMRQCAGALIEPAPPHKILWRLDEPIPVWFRVLDEKYGGATNDMQTAFEERRWVRLPVDIRVLYTTDKYDNTPAERVIRAGVVVNSYFFYDNPQGVGGRWHVYVWEFEAGEEILGVMADRDGVLEAQTSWLLGRPELYAAHGYPQTAQDQRGLEGNKWDNWAIIAPNKLVLETRAGNPGDYLRVVTRMVNSAPVIQPIADQRMLEDGQKRVRIGVSDDHSPNAELVFEADSLNPDVISARDVRVVVTREVVEVMLQPLPEQFGLATIHLRATDQQGAATDASFRVNVTPVNDPPTLNPIVDLAVDENSPEVPVELTGISSGAANERQALNLTATSSNESLIPAPTVDYMGGEPTGILTLAPKRGQSGVATITVTVKDDGGVADGGINTMSREFRVTFVPNLAPTVALTSPVGGQRFEALRSVSLEAEAKDSDGTVVQVEFFASEASLGVDTTPPYAWVWRDIPAGEYRLTARAIDDDGAVAESEPVLVQAISNVPPSVSLIEPAEGQRFKAPASILLTAVATDSDGSVAQVEFFANGTSLGVDITRPFRFRWEDVPVGDYRLTAQATDDDGTMAESLAVNVSVVMNQPPAIRFLHPHDGQLVARQRPLELAVEAWDNDGQVLSVEFFASSESPGDASSSIGKRTRAPFSFEFAGIVAEGTHQFVAAATDDDGAVAWSEPVSVEAIGGDILIIAPAGHPETVALQEGLSAGAGFEVPLPAESLSKWSAPEVVTLDETVVTPALAGGFRVLIWDDLGAEPASVPLNVVETLWSGWQSGCATYLIGERLATAADKLEPAAQRLWTQLTGLAAASGHVGPGWLRRQEPVDRENEFFDSNFPPGSAKPPVEDLCYPRPLERVVAIGKGDVRATVDDCPVLVRYPRFDEPENPFLGQRVVQGVLVGEDGSLPGHAGGCSDPLLAESWMQRQRLFQNAVLWLLGAACDNFVTRLESVSLPTLQPCVPGHVVISVNNNGACAASGVVVTQTVPEALSFSRAWTESSHGSVYPDQVLFESKRVMFGVGQLAPGENVEIHALVVADKPGEYHMTFTAKSRLRAEFRQSFTLDVAGEPCTSPRLEAKAIGNEVILIQHGTSLAPTVLESSSDLRSWTRIQTNTTAGDGQEILRVPTSASARFYRLVVQASEP